MVSSDERVEHLVIRCEEDVGSQHGFFIEDMNYGDIKAESKQFKVELFQGITKLNKLRKFSKEVVERDEDQG
ncbi:hypothetical protein N665_0146s0025 [Sinapis alba]|nr:hypothetical protein N665_0146s0025 [Sinapis alba]